jgi:hypothetical protein
MICKQFDCVAPNSRSVFTDIIFLAEREIGVATGRIKAEMIADAEEIFRANPVGFMSQRF